MTRRLGLRILCWTAVIGLAAACVDKNPAVGTSKQAQVSSSKVMVNQLGYPLGATKIGVVIDSATSPGTIEVVNSAGTTVWTGGQTVVRAADQNSGDAVHHADFSGFATAGGGYRLRVTLGGTAFDSESFSIGDDILDQTRLAAAVIKGFTWKRSGIAVAADPEFNIPGHAISHAADVAVPAYEGWSSATFDVGGGWYDAGDFGKYLESHTAATWQLGNLFERQRGRQDPNGNTIEALSLGINDSPLPDVLDELAWGTRWVRGMLPNPTTHISNPTFLDLASNKVADQNWAPFVRYEDDPAPSRRAMGPSTSATHSAARNMAMVSRLLRPYGTVPTIVDMDGTNNLTAAQYADKLWEGAKEAFGRATGKHPDFPDYVGAQASNMLLSDLDFSQSPGFNNGSGGYGDEDMLDDELAAAVELYLTACERGDATAVNTYRPIVTGHPYYKVAGQCDWGSERKLGDEDGEENGCSLLSLLTVHDAVCTGAFALPAADIAEMKANLLTYVDEVLVNISGQNYPFYAPDGSRVVWGSNSTQAGYIVALTAAYEHSGNKQYLDAAFRLFDYLLGVNPVKTSYVIGFGDAAEEFTHDRAMIATNSFVRGTLVGGPHNVDEFFAALLARWGGGSSIDDPATPDSGPALKRYAANDDGRNSWESKENAVNWIGTLANAVWSLQVHADELGCSTDADCDDGSLCTVDSCVQGVCRNAAVVCDDGRVCTVDSCNPATGTCSFDSTQCCDTEAECSDGTACTEDRCGADELCANPDRNICCTNTGALSPIGATASSVENNNFPPGNAIDGNPGSRWSSAFSDPQWIALDIGFITYVQRVVLRWETAASANYDIQVSNSPDGPWTTIFTRTNGTGGTEDIDAQDGLEPAPGRYVRMIGYSRTTPYGHSLFEFEVYGDPDPDCFQTTVTCGDRSCDAPETCASCSIDCCSSEPQCTVDADCNDQNECTDDTCNAGVCTNSNNTAPCTDDGSSCTDDVCSGGICTHPSNGSCQCTVDADCDDQNECTDDVCDQGACVNSNNTGPCTDDGDTCTDDVCSGGVCTHPDNGSCGATCGDGVCDADETCSTCATDCGACPGGCTCPQGCGAVVNAAVPLTKDGADNVCYFFPGSLGSFVNSWNNEEVNVNGVDATNQWLGASDYPSPIDGGYYLYYRGAFPWSHLEVK